VVRAVADARLQAAIDNWGPRMISNGIDYNDFTRTTGSISRWEEWLEAWSATGDVHRELGEQALGDGHARTAGEAFLRAAVSYHFSKFVWVLDPSLNRRSTEAAVRAQYDALRLLEPSAERIEAPLGDGFIAANLRRPTGGERVPLVILIPGLDSTKEEFYLLESVFLARGMATLSLDGPGQGETRSRMVIRPDYEVAVSAAIDALSTRAGSDLDLDRIGATGVSMGGYYVARSAAFEPRLRAIAGVSGLHSVGEWWRSMPSLSREAFTYYSGSSDVDEAVSRAEEMTLAGVAERIEQPHLVVTGARDRVVPWEMTKRIADESPRSEWVLYEDGSHVCNNIPFKYRPLVADWLRDRLS
jgi:pimeloyl-ACP methyl ester carboxylesterase